MPTYSFRCHQEYSAVTIHGVCFISIAIYLRMYARVRDTNIRFGQIIRHLMRQKSKHERFTGLDRLVSPALNI